MVALARGLCPFDKLAGKGSPPGRSVLISLEIPQMSVLLGAKVDWLWKLSLLMMPVTADLKSGSAVVYRMLLVMNRTLVLDEP